MVKTMTITLLVLYFCVVWKLVFGFSKVCGKLTLKPGTGSINIPLEFVPKSAKVKFVGRAYPIPGCSQLEDTVSVKISGKNLILDYKIQTGIRKVKWCARR